MSSLPVQLVLFINARHYRTFNLQQYLSFTISHLKSSLAEDFGVPLRKIHFTLYSGLFIRDQDGLFNLRASDGNHASLDITLPEHYSSSELAGKVISFKFRDNPQPTDLRAVSSDGIQKVDLEHDDAQLEYHGASISPASPESPKLTLHLTKEQKVALRAQYEDPFNISSRSCFEEEFEDEESADDESDGGADDDLYSDDGASSPEELDTADCEVEQKFTPSEATDAPTQAKKAWPSDPAQLKYEHLVSLASATSFYHPKRELPMRFCLLKSNFQRKLQKEILKAQSKVTSLSRSRNMDLPAGFPGLSTPPTLNSQKVCFSSPTKPRPSLTPLVIPELSSALSVGVISHKETLNSPVVSVAGGDCLKRASTALRLTNLLLSLQSTRAFSRTEQRHKQVYVVHREVGLYNYGSLRASTDSS